MPIFTHKDLHWFYLANAATGYWLKQDFYGFKRQFLQQHGTLAGFDLQTLSSVCWSCDGSGMFTCDQECRKCGGSGTFGPGREIILRRFDLAGRIYHVPTEPGEIEVGDVPVHGEIEGIIKHEQVPAQVGFRCYMRLLLRYKPTRFHEIAMQWLVRKRGSNKRLFNLIRRRFDQDLILQDQGSVVMF